MSLIFTDSPADALRQVLNSMEYSGPVFLLADENTARCCLPLISDCPQISSARIVTIGAGDECKNIESLSKVWEDMTMHGATRGSVLVNLGGGVVTDLGGFAAATFKRGISFVNIPTTLLSAVDAAVGGKTGINFCGFKNEVGAFAPAMAVIISAAFYSTLPYQELISGYGEVLKHALLDSPEALTEALLFDLQKADTHEISGILRRSVEVKERVVRSDPYEQGPRRALNLGHTAAHAFEALAMKRSQHLAHGVAVAHGLVVALVLSHIRLGFPSAVLQQVAQFVKTYYPAPIFGCKDYAQLIEFMRHDKKNSSVDAINFTLLESPGEVRINCRPSEDEIKASLDITGDLL